MIHITGAIRRAFLFPAAVEDAYTFYAQLPQTFGYLPHIKVAEVLSEHAFRMHYHTVELGTYHVNIIADIDAYFEPADHSLTVRPVPDSQPVKARARMNTATTSGAFYIQSWFTPAGDQTHVEFALKLEAQLPRPLGMRFMPRSVVDRIAHSITNRRMREIVEGFIENSIAAFDDQPLATIPD